MRHTKKYKLLAGLGIATALAGQAGAAVYLNETFEDDTLDAAPADPAQRRVLATLTAAGSGLIGTDNVANYNDTSAGAGGSLEYNVGAAPLGALYASFDLLNVAPNNDSTTPTNPLIFGMANFSETTSVLLSANANRAFGIEFYHDGTSNNLKLRVGGSAVLNTPYDSAQLLSVQVYVNDHDTNGLGYIRPDTATSDTLNANSFVVYVNGVLTGATAGGYAMNTVGVTGGNTTGNATLGRLGFNTSSTTLANFLIDNVYASDVAPVPEPGSLALLALGGGLIAARRRVR